MTRLHELHREQDQSPWLDDLKRSYLQDGTLAKRVDEGIRGVTSNPTIFAKAISSDAAGYPTRCALRSASWFS